MRMYFQRPLSAADKEEPAVYLDKSVSDDNAFEIVEVAPAPTPIHESADKTAEDATISDANVDAKPDMGGHATIRQPQRTTRGITSRYEPESGWTERALITMTYFKTWSMTKSGR